MSPGEFKSKWAWYFRRTNLPTWGGYTGENATFLLRYSQIRQKPLDTYSQESRLLFNNEDIRQTIFLDNPNPEADKWLTLLSTPTP